MWIVLRPRADACLCTPFCAYPPGCQCQVRTLTNFGLVLQIFDLTMEIEVEDHGGGNAEIRQCSTMSAHFVSDDVPAFTPATGLLGMDQFDAIQADPVKSADGTRAYLAKRA